MLKKDESKKKNIFSRILGFLYNKIKWIILLLIIVIVVLLVLYSKTSEYVVSKYASGFVHSKTSKVIKNMDEDYLKFYEEYMERSYADYLEEQFASWKDEGYKVLSYKILSGKRLKEDDRNKVAKKLNEYYKMDEDSVEDVIVYDIEFKTKSNGVKDTNDSEVTAVKMNGKWFIFAGNIY